MNKREWISDILGDEALLADGMDEAIIGIAERCGMAPVPAYSRSKIIEILSREMPGDEAEEYFEFNIAGAWVGEGTPVFIDFLCEQ